METGVSEAVLYHDGSYHVVVIDIPRSVELATCLAGAVSTRVAVAPFASTEPKGRKFERMLAELPDEERRWHGEICEQVREILNRLHSDEPINVWNLPRKIHEPERVLVDELPSLVDFTAAPMTVLSCLENIFAHHRDVQNSFVVNPANSVTRINLRGKANFLIPPRATFLWASIDCGLDAFQQYGKSLNADESALQFDLILMDPPWPNRSARNAKSYITAESQEKDPFDQLIPFMANHRTEGGFIAIWITNKASIRRRVMETMKVLGLTTAEEWIWVKVTASGEPVLPIDGIWRKPYEVLLLFSAGHTDKTAVRGARRFIFGASDFHSRKPNLKCLFDRLFNGSYRAIEIFARNLTSGWFGWGDEVLKYQDASYWRETDT